MLVSYTECCQKCGALTEAYWKQRVCSRCLLAQPSGFRNHSHGFRQEAQFTVYLWMLAQESNLDQLTYFKAPKGLCPIRPTNKLILPSEYSQLLKYLQVEELVPLYVGKGSRRSDRHVARHEYPNTGKACFCQMIRERYEPEGHWRWGFVRQGLDEAEAYRQERELTEYLVDAGYELTNRI